ncbi:MAG: hypothetical protein AAGN82_10645 [Myxococcota bacterium]
MRATTGLILALGGSGVGARSDGPGVFALSAAEAAAQEASQPAAAEKPDRGDDDDVSATDKAAAEAMFAEGRALLKAERFEAAADKLAESMRLDPQTGTQINLALAYEKIGRWASAWINYREVVTKAERDGQAKRARYAAARVATLEPKLARLVIDVPEPVKGLRVTRRDETVGSAQWGTPIPVDPGTWRLRAEADGYRPWRRQIDVPDAPETTTVVIPALEADPSPEPPFPASDRRDGSQLLPPRLVGVAEEGADDDDPGGAQRTAGFVVGGIGLASLVAGAVTGGVAIERDAASKAFCATDDPNRCFEEGVSIRDEALRFAHASTATLAIGGALVATGLVVVLTADDGGDDASERADRGRSGRPFSYRVTPWFDPGARGRGGGGGGGLHMEVTF